MIRSVCVYLHNQQIFDFDSLNKCKVKTEKKD